MERLPTGVAELDRRLGGGVPAGTLVALVAPPATQSELLLREPLDANGGTYLSALRPADEAAVPDGATAEHARPEELLAGADSLLAPVGDGEAVLVDPVNELEADADRDRYVDFLATLKSRLRETGGVGFLHALEQASEPPLRWLTLARADAVWNLHLAVTPLAVETRLTVTKARGDRTLDEPLKLRLSDRVSVDTSRDI